MRLIDRLYKKIRKYCSHLLISENFLKEQFKILRFNKGKPHCQKREKIKFH